MAVLKMELPLMDGLANVRIESVSPNTFALLDFQRSYGRSAADRQVLQGEFITRINY